jgi:hypothetical protein
VVTFLIRVWEVADWNPSQNQLPNWFFSMVFQRYEVAKWIELVRIENQVKCQAVVLMGLNVSILLLVCHITRKSMFELWKIVRILFIDTNEV